MEYLRATVTNLTEAINRFIERIRPVKVRLNNIESVVSKLNISSGVDYFVSADKTHC